MVRGVGRWAPAVLVVATCLTAACTGSTGDTQTTADPTDATIYEPGDSGMFVVEPVPAGWAIDRAYEQEKGSGVYYAKGGDEDVSFSVLTFTVDPADPEIEAMRRAMEEGDGITPVEVAGHTAYRSPLTDDGKTYGDQVVWFARPELAVSVQVPWSSDVDVEALAASVHEISVPARDALVQATSGGGIPGSPVEALRGTVDGDEWVLSATLPATYPLTPVDDRRGCAVLSFRGESATTCDGRFTTLDNGTQAVVGGVDFVFGVVGGGEGTDVVLRQPENRDAPSIAPQTTVLPAAPGLTWFVTTFDDVCDRYAVSTGGGSIPLAVPAGHPHRNDCAA